jgi:hypothetical protein
MGRTPAKRQRPGGFGAWPIASFSCALRHRAGQNCQGGDRDGRLDGEGAERQEPDFVLCLPIHCRLTRKGAD